MSWDLMIFNTQGKKPPPIEDFEETDFEPLGPAAVVRQKLSELLPGIDWSDPTWGIYRGDGFSIEFNVGEDDPIENIGLHVRGGSRLASCFAFGLRVRDVGSLDRACKNVRPVSPGKTMGALATYLSQVPLHGPPLPHMVLGRNSESTARTFFAPQLPPEPALLARRRPLYCSAQINTNPMAIHQATLELGAADKALRRLSLPRKAEQQRRLQLSRLPLVG